jgi:hypothetical protein
VASRGWFAALSKLRAVLVACVIACSFAAITHSAIAADPTVVPLEGDAFPASLVSAADGRLQFLQGTEKKSLALDQLVRFGDFVEPKRGPIWLFSDGGLLVAELSALDKDMLRGDSELFGKLSLNVSALAGILIRPPGDRVKRDSLVGSLLAPQRESDRIILDNGDELTGIIEAISNHSIAVATNGSRVDVELTRVAAISFSGEQLAVTRPASRYYFLGFADGSRLTTESLTADAKELNFVSNGATFKSRVSTLIALQCFGAPLVYLSDLAELSFKHVPYLQLAWPLKKDTNVLGQPLRVTGKRYLKGLGMHTASRVTYKLAEPCRAFQAELAIDDSAQGKGSAVCSVFVDDGSGKWQPKYTSPVIRGGESPVPVRIDLTGVKAISLLTDFADRGDELDHVDWLNARLVQRTER